MGELVLTLVSVAILISLFIWGCTRLVERHLRKKEPDWVREQRLKAEAYDRKCREDIDRNRRLDHEAWLKRRTR